MTSAERRLPWAVGAAVALAYLAMPSRLYNFDGVACAIAVELADLRHLAHGNHVAYGLIGLAFDRLWRLLGYQGTALLSLQILDSLLGAFGAAAFCRLLLRRLSVEPLAAALCSIGLALSYGWWLWSLEAQVYILGAALAILAADDALAGKPRAGLWQGLAILGHVGHLMFLPFGLAHVKDRRGYLLRLAGVVAAGYVIGALCVRPQGYDEWRAWLLGSAALKVDRSFTWYTGSLLSNVRDWSFMTLRIFSDSPLAWLLGGSVVAAALWAAREHRKWLLWPAGYALLFMSWQPFTLVYRISDLPALWALAALSRPPLWALALWTGGAFLYNGALMRERTKPSPEHEQALALKRTTPENAWIVTTGLGQVYVPYFGHRKPLNLRYYEEPGSLERKIAELEARGEPVYDMNGQPRGSRQKKLKSAAADKKGPNGMGSARRSRPRAISDKP